MVSDVLLSQNQDILPLVIDLTVCSPRDDHGKGGVNAADDGPPDERALVNPGFRHEVFDGHVQPTLPFPHGRGRVLDRW